MAGSWNEIRGTREIERGGVGHIDWVCTFQAARGTAQPALGLAYTDVSTVATGDLNITATGTVSTNPSMSLVAAPEVVQVGQRVRFTENLDQIRVRFRGFLKGS